MYERSSTCFFWAPFPGLSLFLYQIVLLEVLVCVGQTPYTGCAIVSDVAPAFMECLDSRSCCVLLGVTEQYIFFLTIALQKQGINGSDDMLNA